MNIPSLKEISDRIQNLPIDQKRSGTDSYIEIVILNEKMSEWMTFLEKQLGAPAKSSSQKPTREQETLAEPNGGISKGQTLFKKELENGLIVAMLWPWQDEKHTTLKIFTAEKISATERTHEQSSIIHWIKSLFEKT